MDSTPAKKRPTWQDIAIETLADGEALWRERAASLAADVDIYRTIAYELAAHCADLGQQLEALRKRYHRVIADNRALRGDRPIQQRAA